MRTVSTKVPRGIPRLRGYLAERRIKVRAIAEAYGCTPAYISAVLREEKGVTRETLERVIAAIRRAEQERENALCQS